MNITKELKDNLNAVVKVQIEKEDYESRVKKVLTDYQKKARLDGFRPGKVPFGLIQKMYGKSALVEEINKLLSENLLKYIKEEDLQIIGEPLPSEKEQKEIDWDNSEAFEFAFDLGLSPQFDINISKDDVMIVYDIQPDEKLVETYTDNYARRYGAFQTSDTVSDGKEMLKGSFTEVESDGKAKENGITAQDSTIHLEFMKDEETKKKFMGLKQGDSITFNLAKAYPNNVEMASILHMKKEEVEGLESDFLFTIESVSMFRKAEINQELFDKIYGEGNVKTEEEFKAKISEEIKANLSRESQYKFRMDAKEALLNKANINLPVDFLKRWVFSSNEGKFTMEQIDADFPKFERDIRWQLIQNKIVKQSDIKISEEEIVDFAKEQTRMQFEQYGLFNVPDEHIVSYAMESLKREEDRHRLIDHKLEDKVLDFVRANVTIENKEVSPEQFDKVLEESNSNNQ